MRNTGFFPCSLFPVPCSLFPVPCSLFPKTRYSVPHQIEQDVRRIPPPRSGGG
ncbi:hypothetical protein [Moorena sp. SIO3A5]|uniref:hypothetical protein n=1 Tax=Moorena sp. SIO3A5 TaxID=2607822 RepID=UPI00031ECF33|nr:hypothetical protein [Moorena sp. SIO3A5]